MAQDNLNQVHSGDADITVTFTGMESILLLNLLSQSIREPGVRASGEVSNSIVALWRKISSLVEREVNCSDCLKIIKDEAVFVARIE